MEMHNIEPIFDSEAVILILGSFPSVKSRQGKFFYNHPQNRFWKVLSRLFDQTLPVTVQDKKDFLQNNKIAVWDVIQSCEIVNSSDTSIKNVKVNNISLILDSADIKAIFTNGQKAYELYNRYIFPRTNIKAILLPSTSPANAAYSIEKLCEKWKVIKDYIF